MNKNFALRLVKGTLITASFFVLAIGLILVGVIVGDWVVIHTEDPLLGWLVGAFCVLGSLVSMGIAIGIWLWLRSPLVEAQQKPHILTDSVQTIIDSAQDRPRD